jgi:DNA-binding protein H-NS
MSIDLTPLTIPELQQVIIDATARIDVLKKNTVAELRRKLQEMAREHGYTIGDLFPDKAGSAVVKSGSKPVAPKYANPANPMQTWSGRGKQPHWVRDAIKAGATMSDFVIK